MDKRENSCRGFHLEEAQFMFVSYEEKKPTGFINKLGHNIIWVKLLVSYMQFFNDLSQYNSDKLYTFLLSKPFHINPSDYKILNDKKIKDYYGSLIDKIKYMIKLSDEVKSLIGIDEKKQQYELNKK